MPRPSSRGASERRGVAVLSKAPRCRASVTAKVAQVNKDACAIAPALTTPDVAHLTLRQLLALHARVADELSERGITRGSSNPTGDLAEYLLGALFCK